MPPWLCNLYSLSTPSRYLLTSVAKYHTISNFTLHFPVSSHQSIFFPFTHPASSEEPLQVIFHRLLAQSPWYPLLQHFVPSEVSQNFLHVYTMDFIRMTYISNTCSDNELEVSFKFHSLSLYLYFKFFSLFVNKYKSTYTHTHPCCLPTLFKTFKDT